MDQLEDLTLGQLRQYPGDIQLRPRWFETQSQSEPTSTSYYQTHYRRLNTFFNWLVEEEII